MSRPDHIGFYIAGFIAALSFARTAWVFPNISRWFYIGDLIARGSWICPCSTMGEEIRRRRARRQTNGGGEVSDRIYIASRASIPERAAEWRRYSDNGIANKQHAALSKAEMK